MNKIVETLSELQNVVEKYDSLYPEVESLIKDNYYCNSIGEFIDLLESLPNNETEKPIEEKVEGEIAAQECQIESSPVSKPKISFEEIYSFKDNLHHFVYNISKNDADTEEIVQDTMIRAYNGMGNFRGECSVKTWLFTIAQRLAYNKYDYYKRRKTKYYCSFDQTLSDDSETTLADVIKDESVDLIEDISLQEQEKLILTKLSQLKSKSRRYIEMTYIEHLTYDEIAAKLNIKVGTVKSRLSRARESLRRLLLENEFKNAKSSK